MDFDRAHMEAFKHGRYEPLDVSKLPPLYIAYRTDLAEVSDVAHKSLRQRYEQGDPVLLDAIRFWAQLTVEFRAAMQTGDRRRMAELMDANFDRRAKTYRISEGNMRMIQAARSVGASAKFTGSGGAIIGTYEGEEMYERLERVLGGAGIRVLRPDVAPPVEEDAP
jgi:glucuronokinase